jgi:integrase/recombinase XerD
VIRCHRYEYACWCFVSEGIVDPLEGKISIAFADVERVWRENRCLTEYTIWLYGIWARRFIEYCHGHRLRPKSELTHAGTTRFVHRYARGRDLSTETLKNGRTALHRWSEALQTLGERLLPWRPGVGIRTGPPVSRERSALLDEYAGHMRRYRGMTVRTITVQRFYLERLLKFLRKRGRSVRRIRLIDIDALLAERRGHWSVRTVADLCTAVRGFLRFLYISGRVKADLSGSVLSPRIRRGDRPPRALPWPDVQRVLRGIERKSPVGRRDYALMLMMSVYGCGAAEVIRLGLADVDWQAQTLRVVRPKTGVEIHLPLLPAVARALSDYLRHGRPPHAPTRVMFVRMKPPHGALATSSAVRHILCRWAARAQVRATFLGSHALRHAHACRQMELGTRPKLIGDILGHRNPQSTSVYLRVATERLRALALPVPR